MIIIYVLCKHNKLQTLVASSALQQLREVSTSATKKEDDYYMCDCTSQFYIILVHHNRISYTGGSHLSWIFWEHENQSGLLVMQLIYIKLYRKKETKFWRKKNPG